jgi:hypothetical protein
MNPLQKIFFTTLDNIEIVIVSAIFGVYALRNFSIGKYFWGVLFLFLGIISLLFLGGFLTWVHALGGDSFLEASNFNIREAVFWVTTLPSLVPLLMLPVSNTLLLLTVETIALSIITFFIVRWRPNVSHVLALVLLIGAGKLAYLGYAGFELGRSYITHFKNQFDSNPLGFKATEEIDLFVYIGESTSTLNMSLYGYPLSTTPQLDRLFMEDGGFLRFEGIRSTHTHTSPSLIRALAITSPKIDGRIKQWGIGSILEQAGVNPKLHSVQPLNGSFALFSHFIYSGMDFELNAEEKYKGNYTTPNIKDHTLLDKALKDSGVVFFHSYAGHGGYKGYLDLIDTSLSKDIPKPVISFEGLYGSLFTEFNDSDLHRNANSYDQAITYIDRNVALAINHIKTRSRPAVLIYFSDHGQSVYSKRGHDSSRYIDEMTTVPMVMYFNKAYQNKYRDKFQAYKYASIPRKTKLLDQISPTIIDILYINSVMPIDVPTLAISINDSANHPRPYILERDTLSNPSHVNLIYNDNVGFSRTDFVGGTPEPTYISIINEKFGREQSICYHRSNSYAKALRAAAVTNCIEFDLVVEDSKLNVFHPPKKASGLQIEHIFSIAETRKNNLWIDAKNIYDPMACNMLASYLESNHARVGKIFVEFPSAASSRFAELLSCSKRLTEIGVSTSYYVPINLLLPCAENPVQNTVQCRQLSEDVQTAMKSGNFSDLSFDFIGYSAMQRIEGAKRLKWNTWSIKAQDFHRFPRQDFGFIIMDTSTDPNSN